MIGVTPNHLPKRGYFRFHETILRFGEPGSLGIAITGVSWNNGTTQNTLKWSFLVGKPMVVGYHHFRKHPYVTISSWTKPQRFFPYHLTSVVPCCINSDFPVRNRARRPSVVRGPQTTTGLDGAKSCVNHGIKHLPWDGAKTLPNNGISTTNSSTGWVFRISEASTVVVSSKKGSPVFGE